MFTEALLFLTICLEFQLEIHFIADTCEVVQNLTLAYTRENLQTK